MSTTLPTAQALPTPTQDWLAHPHHEPIKPPIPRRRGSGLIWMLLGGVFLVALLGGGGLYLWLHNRSDQATEITAAVKRADLPITVTERGELESSKTKDGRCEVEGRQIKIIEILPEGTHVKEGDVVVKFDAEELTRQKSDQEIKYKQAKGKFEAAKQELEVQKNKAEGDDAKAKLDLDLARLDLEKYEKGDFVVAVKEGKADIALAQRDLDEARQKLDETKGLMKKGFATLEQVRIQEGSVLRYQFVLDSKKDKLDVLEKYDLRKNMTEKKAKAEDAVRNLARTGATGKANIAKAQSDLEAAEVLAKLEEQALDRFKKQLDKCVVKAPQDGILVYPKDRYWDPSMKVQVGGMVHYQQTLFSLPDLNQLQIKVKIHESRIKKVQKGQKCEIRPEAFQNTVLHGTVEKVATLADNERYWDERGVKEYITIIKVDDVPSELGLKPGMSAEVKVLINTLPDVLLVPVQAVTEKEGKNIAYVVTSSGVERREIVIGENNDKFVQIKEGIEEGEQVALDARARIAAETKSSNGKPENGKPETTEPGKSKVVAMTK